jgi:hypothetical protein
MYLEINEKYELDRHGTLTPAEISEIKRQARLMDTDPPLSVIWTGIVVRLIKERKE